MFLLDVTLGTHLSKSEPLMSMSQQISTLSPFPIPSQFKEKKKNSPGFRFLNIQTKQVEHKY